MSEPLSSTYVYALSSFYKSEFLNFVNHEREISYVENTNYSAEIDISYPEFSKYITDLSFRDSYYTFLTSVSRLSSYFNSLQGFGGNYYGSKMQDFTAKYNWILNNFTLTASAYEDTQFLGIMDRESNFNFIPLKSKISINDEQYSTIENYKKYEKIYEHNDSLFLQFQIDKIPVEIIPDRYNTIFNSYNVSATNINNTEFIKNGGIGGNCPLNSDVIFFDTSEYGKYTNNGPNNINSFNNGTLLCLWLSSQTVEPDSPKIWMERWYDPNTVTNGNAFISQKNNTTDSLTYIFDVSSTKVLSPKEKFVYLRYGGQRNNTFVNSLSSNLKIHFNGWSKNFTSVDQTVQGYIIGNYPLSSRELNLDGTIHAHIPPEDPLFVDKDLTLGVWANSVDWKFNVDSQLFGNFNNESGYGIFYNTGVPNNLISIPTKSNNLFALNYKGFKVFEKDLKNDLALSSINIEYIKTDLFGNRWLYDSENQNIFKIENDDLVITKIDLPSNAEITKIDCNSNNEVYIFDNFNKSLSSFDADGTLLGSQSVSSNINIFEIDKNDNILLDAAEFITVNSLNQVIKIVGSTLLVDNERVLHLTDKPTSIRIDSENNIWILLKNQIIKTDPKGELLFTKTIDVGFTDYSAEMGFVKIFKNSLEEIQLWIIFNSGKYIVILDLNGRIVKRIDLVPLFVGNQCSQFQLKIQGDFCGFDSRRKYEIINDKPISPLNPAFSVKLSLTNGISKKIIQAHSSTETVDQWTHITFSVENQLNKTVVKLFVDGRLQNSKIVNGNYRIDYSYKSTPFIIGGISGKLGAKNLEKSIVDVGYFVGQINEIRLYDRILNDYEIMNLALNRYYTDWKSSSLYLSVPPIRMVEQIDTLHLNRYKGFKSNYFNIKIKNFTNDEIVQNVVRDYIINEISNWVPVNTILNSIKFE